MPRQAPDTLNRQERKRLRRFILLLGLIAALLLLFIPGRSYMNYRAMRQQVATLAEDNQRLEQRNRELAEEIDRLQNDDAYLEELARKKYGLLKKNETVYEFKSGRKKKE